MKVSLQGPAEREHQSLSEKAQQKTTLKTLTIVAMLLPLTVGPSSVPNEHSFTCSPFICFKVCFFQTPGFQDSSGGQESSVDKSASLMIKKLQVRITARAVGGSSSPELTFCADTYSVSFPSLCYCSSTQKTLVILPKVQLAG